MRKFGLTIDGKHTTEYGLKMLSMYIPQPAVKTNLISVPGASGSIDLSEVSGQRCYENRNDLMGSSMVLPVVSAISPRIPASCLIC